MSHVPLTVPFLSRLPTAQGPIPCFRVVHLTLAWLVKAPLPNILEMSGSAVLWSYLGCVGKGQRGGEVLLVECSGCRRPGFLLRLCWRHCSAVPGQPPLYLMAKTVSPDSPQDSLRCLSNSYKKEVVNFSRMFWSAFILRSCINFLKAKLLTHTYENPDQLSPLHTTLLKVDAPFCTNKHILVSWGQILVSFLPFVPLFCTPKSNTWDIALARLPGTSSVDLNWRPVLDLPALAFWVLGLQTCTTTTSQYN